MPQESLGNKAIKGTIWAAIDRFGTIILQFFVNIILARLLTPFDFGAVGMLAIFITVSMVFVDGGFGAALIQKKDSNQTDFSTIFFWNLGIATILYLILFTTAPWIASFYNLEILSPVLRTLGIILILNAIVAVQTAKLQKTLAFKELASVNIFSYLIGATISTYIAYIGFGVWSLASLSLASTLFRIICFYFITHWHPSINFSKESFLKLFSFGGYLLCANLLQAICQNAQGLIIGKRFSAIQLGYYTQADKLNQVTSDSIPRIIIQVMYPVYSQIQDNREKLIATILLNLRVISFLVFPLLSCLILVAHPLIGFLYGDKWLTAVPYFQILCIGGMFTCLTNINYYAVAAVGKSKALFWWSLYKWGVLLFLLIGSSFISMTAMVWSVVISNFNIFLINILLSRKYVGVQLIHILKSLGPIAALSFAIYCCLFYINGYVYPLHWGLMILLFAISFLIFAFIFHFKSLNELLMLIKMLKL